MLTQIEGIHHITSLASSARTTDAFFTGTFGLRRVKKTVNFDAPDVYHLYYGDALGTPGTVMTYFPFPRAARGTPGAGEVGTTAFAVPRGSLGRWRDRLADAGVAGVHESARFGDGRLDFAGPDGDGFALVEADDDRAPWTAEVPQEMAIRGFHSASLRLADTGATEELLRFMGYERVDAHGDVVRYALPEHNGAGIVDLESRPDAPQARQGAGSVHHIAFSVADRDRQASVRAALVGEGWQVTPVIDRDYFWAVYFRTPGGVLFEVATGEPGFARDEEPDHLGEALKLPSQHAHLRDRLERALEPIG
jgi:glyoxalase family protein